MPILDPTPKLKDVVLIQRSDDGSYYGEVHISGSSRIIYIDSNGHVNADTSASFYTVFPPSGYTGPLNDSTTNKIADVVGGIIVKVYY